jgi:hypothetical protein
MIELDYAYIADHAQISEGKITAVGASFTQVIVEQFPAVIPLSVAGRVRASHGTTEIPISINIHPEDMEFDLHFDGKLDASNSLAYEGKVGVLFAMGTQVPLSGPGLIEVIIKSGDNFVRRLAFSVEAK